MVLFAEHIGKTADAIDRSKDCVLDEKTAKEIAEAFFDENDPDWREDGDYEVKVIFIEQIYKWVVWYTLKAPEGTVVLDGSKIVRIRRDNGEVTYYG